MLLYKLTNDYKNRVNIKKRKHPSKSKQNKSKISKVLIPRIIKKVNKFTKNAFKIGIDAEILKIVNNYF